MDYDLEDLDPELAELCRLAGSQPDNWELQLDVHTRLITANRREEAAHLLQHLEIQFPNEPDVLAHVGSALTGKRDREKRTRGLDLLERALELCPEHDFARSALFSVGLEDGDLALAERMVSEDTPELRELLIEHADRLGDGERVERLREGDSSPPPDEVWSEVSFATCAPRPEHKPFTPARLLTIMAAIGIGGVLLLSTLTASGRRLFVVNGTGSEAVVTVSEAGEPDRQLTLPSGATKPLELGEGTYQVHVRHRWGEATHSLNMTTDFWKRAGEAQTVFVLNVAGVGALLHEEQQYVKIVDLAPPEAPTYVARLAFGEPIQRFTKVHYRFRPWAKRVSERKQPTVSDGPPPLRARLSFLAGAPAQVLEQTPTAVSTANVLDYLEFRLRLEQDPETVQVYQAVANAEGARERGQAFLEALGAK